MRFRDRHDAAERLVRTLRDRGARFDAVVALPRGGVELGAVIATAFGVPIDLSIPRKIGAPANEEYAIGAVTERGEVWNEREREGTDPAWIEESVTRERAEAGRRRSAYLTGKKPIPLAGKRVLVVDDGIATGLTMRAALDDVRSRKPAWIGVAVPIAAADAAGSLARICDEVIALETPAAFSAIGEFYEAFPQVEDEEVVSLLKGV